MGVDVCLDN